MIRAPTFIGSNVNFNYNKSTIAATMSTTIDNNNIFSFPTDYSNTLATTTITATISMTTKYHNITIGNC